MKRHILRIMTLCTAGALALASCNKNKDAEGTVPENGFRASTEQGGGDSKTHLDGTAVKWDAADLILIRSQENGGRTLTYELTEGEGTQNGTFYTGEEHESFFVPSYTAVYPAYNSDEVANSITGDGAATFTLPATQKYVANSFAKGAMPMMAVSSDQSLAFKNVLGGICFPLTGSHHVTRVVLTGNNGEKLCGVFTADYNSGNPTLTYGSGGGSSVTVSCNLTLTGTATNFYVMLPPVVMTNGFTLKVYDGDSESDKIYEKSTGTSTAIHRNEILYLGGPDSGSSIEIVVVPEGAISGLFTVEGTVANPTRKVYFSKGNLQYRASESGTAGDLTHNVAGGGTAQGQWRFAEHQWDYVGNGTSGTVTGSSNASISQTYIGWIDLFGWGTSGWNSGANAYQPYSTSTSYSDYYPGGSSTNNLTGSYANADWGVYNEIVVDDAGTIVAPGTYRTLTNAEWSVLIGRTVNGGTGQNHSYTYGRKVNDVLGVIIYPDDYTGGTPSADLSVEEWASYEDKGCVFLPCAGLRSGTSLLNVGSYGHCWSSTCNGAYGAYYVLFFSGNFYTNNYYRYYGRSVRLVRVAE